MTFSAIASLPVGFGQPLISQRKAIQAILAVFSLFNGLLDSTALAGLAASDVVVVVNGNSINSRTLANHFVSLRKIPASNVIVLDGVPNSEVISIAAFRQFILQPLIAEIDRRQLSSHVQCVSYSADFPTAIDISADLKPLGNLPIYFTPKASINALTYLYSQVLGGSPAAYISLEANFFARRPVEHYFESPGGDATREQWTAIQQMIADKKHSEAVDALEEMLEIHPHQFPIAYLAAAQAAQAADETRALKLLETAISKGWSAGGYLAKDKRFDSLRDNGDFQVLEYLMDADTDELQPSLAFDARIAWTPNGVPTQDLKLGLRYMLSTVLGVTRGGGTSLAEAISKLEQTAVVDSTHPTGGFYFCLSSDVRTTTRQPGFARAIKDLTELGFEAEILNSVLPQNKANVLGAQIGTPNFDWSDSGSQLVPGSIAENLTSLGGVMTTSSGQTKLTELIKAGAAGSSGAVTEPYAMQPKFPDPQLYVHYARGASLAEAFYMSVPGPYQLLIVGDPLCQPFSNAPDPKIATELRYLDIDETMHVEPDLSGPTYYDWLDSDEPRSKRIAPLVPAAIGVLFDNKTPQAAPSKPKIAIQIKGQTAGYHEVCLRFVTDGPLAQRSDAVIPIWIGEKDTVRIRFPQLKGNAAQKPEVSLKAGKINVLIEAQPIKEQKVARMTLWHDSEQLAVSVGQDAEFAIALDTIGMGPVRLQAKAELDDGSIVAGIPVFLNVVP